MIIRFDRRLLLKSGAAALLPLHAARGDTLLLVDVSHIAEPLKLTMTRANDGRHVTEADYRGDVVLLYFGYTFCPDVCPLTLSNLGFILDRLGTGADRVRVLFVTVDPARDTLAVMRQYAAAFGPRVDGLRGTPDALLSLARRYRIAYSVTPATENNPYEVSHSAAIYVFDGAGRARWLIPSLASPSPDVTGIMAALRGLLESHAGPS